MFQEPFFWIDICNHLPYVDETRCAQMGSTLTIIDILFRIFYSQLMLDFPLNYVMESSWPKIALNISSMLFSPENAVHLIRLNSYSKTFNFGLFLTIWTCTMDLKPNLIHKMLFNQSHNWIDFETFRNDFIAQISPHQTSAISLEWMKWIFFHSPAIQMFYTKKEGMNKPPTIKSTRTCLMRA